MKNYTNLKTYLVEFSTGNDEVFQARGVDDLIKKITNYKNIQWECFIDITDYVNSKYDIKP